MNDALTQITSHLVRQSWQIGAVFVLVAAGCLALRRASAHWRYLLWLIVLAKCLVPPLVMLPLAVLPAPQPQPAGPADLPVAAPRLPTSLDEAPGVQPVGTPADGVHVPAPADAAKAQRLPRFSLRQWLTVGWIAGAALFALAALLKAARIQGRLKRLRQPAPAGLTEQARGLAGSVGIRGRVRVWLIDGLGQPFVWGLLRGAVYLPADFGSVSARDRRGILAHELAHVARWDAAVNALQVLVQGLFFFHPLVWWANRKIRQEREKCCDEIAIASLASPPRQYGEAIVGALMVQHKASLAVPSLAVAGPVRNIENRIKTIMARGQRFHRRPTWLAILTAALLAALVIPTAFVLSARAEEKAAATVKAEPSAEAGVSARLPNGVTVELVALWRGATPAERKWWRPDGSAVPKKQAAQYERWARPPGWGNTALRFEYGYLYRMSPRTDVTVHTAVRPGTTQNHLFPREDGIGVGLVASHDYERRKGWPPVGDVRFAVAHGPSKSFTVHMRFGRVRDVHALEDGSAIIVAGPRPDSTQPDKAVVVDATVNAGDVDVQLLYKTKDGNTRKASLESVMGGPNLITWGRKPKTMIQYSFRCPTTRDNLDSITVKFRRFQAVAFKNVALRPGVETTVTTEAVSRAAPAPAGAQRAAPPGVRRSPPAKPASPPPGARETVEAFLAAAAAGRDREAIRLTDPASAVPQQVKELQQIPDLKKVKLATVHADDQAALAVTTELRADRNDKGVLVIRLIRPRGLWIVTDIDFEDPPGLKDERERFMGDHPKAVAIPAQPAGRAGLGPVVERVLNDIDEGKADQLIDFESGSLFTLPKELAGQDEQWLMAWMAQRGIDALVDGAADGWVIGGYDLVAASMRPARWEALSALDVRAKLAAGKPGVRTITRGRATSYLIDGPGCTLAFKTPDGGVGVLQVLAFTENPKGVKLRYSMLQPPPAARTRPSLTKESVEVRALLRGCLMYAADHEGRWPDDLQALVAGHYVKLRDPAQLGKYRYVKPPAALSGPAAGRTAVLWRTPEQWPGRVVVGFADGHVETVTHDTKPAPPPVRTRPSLTKEAVDVRVLLRGCLIYAADHEDRWPDDLQALVAGHYVKLRDAAQLKKYRYAKPAASALSGPTAGRTAVLWRTPEHWPGRVLVGFADGHVETVTHGTKPAPAAP